MLSKLNSYYFTTALKISQKKRPRSDAATAHLSHIFQPYTQEQAFGCVCESVYWQLYQLHNTSNKPHACFNTQLPVPFFFHYTVFFRILFLSLLCKDSEILFAHFSAVYKKRLKLCFGYVNICYGAAFSRQETDACHMTRDRNGETKTLLQILKSKWVVWVIQWLSKGRVAWWPVSETIITHTHMNRCYHWQSARSLLAVGSLNSGDRVCGNISLPCIFYCTVNAVHHCFASLTYAYVQSYRCAQRVLFPITTSKQGQISKKCNNFLFFFAAHTEVCFWDFWTQWLICNCISRLGLLVTL